MVVERYSYDVFGEPNRVSGIGNPYMFTGRRYDPETGLYYYRARYYSPELGRFLQPDPIRYEDGLNLYGYVLNNPVTEKDPYGEVSAARCQALYDQRRKRILCSFTDCFLNCSGAASDIGPLVGICIAGCVKGGLYAPACIVGCMATGGVRMMICSRFCGRLRDAEIESAKRAYERCLEKAEY